MRSLINSTFVSLDGVVNHMDKWHFDFVGGESDALAQTQLDAVSAMLMGRATYDAYVSSWPDRDGAYADPVGRSCAASARRQVLLPGDRGYDETRLV